MHRPYQLEKLISMEMLQLVQDNFSDAVGIALVTVDAAGNPITRPSGFCDFCKAVRDIPELKEACIKCDDVGGRMAMEKGSPSVYYCHAGLTDLAVPIVIRNQYLGAIIAGQVRLTETGGTELSRPVHSDRTLRADPVLQEYFERVPFISYRKLASATNTLFHLTNYLVEQGYTSSVTEELNAKNLKLVQESKKTLELEKSLREAELQALSYQVNPHFLFNVLSAIGRLAYFEGAKETEKVVHGFSDMMRYVLKKNISQFVTIKDEVGHVKNYLYLQKVRMSEKFSFSIDVSETYNSILCPFMVLQPIVENCINYAVEPSENKCFVSIKACDDGKDLTLEVQDNGDGIEPQRIKAALDGSIENVGRSSIGLHNVNQRLITFFGKDYGLEVVSSNVPGEGTLAKMRFPLEFDPIGL